MNKIAYGALWSLLILAAPLYPQKGFMLGGAIGYYTASLDEINQGLLAVQDEETFIQETNGGFIATGSVLYNFSSRVTGRLNISSWTDQAAGRRSTITEDISIVNRVTLIPVLVGLQFFLNNENNDIRPYVGGSAGMVLIRNNIQVSYFSLGRDPIASSTTASGRDFMAYPFFGFQLRGSETIRLFIEGGYNFSNYSVINTDIVTGKKSQDSVSLNGFSVHTGFQVSL